MLRSTCAIALLALTTACGHHEVMVQSAGPADAHVVVISGTYQPDAIRAAIGRALTSRSFATVSDQPGSIVATYSKGARQLRLGIDYDNARVTFHTIQNMGMEGKRADKVITKLDAAIQDELARPAREQAAQAKAQSEAAAAAERQARQDQIDAEERQRSYNVAMEHEKTKQARAMAPPPVRVEVQGNAPGEGQYWTAGHWGWQNGQYAWIPGFWAASYANQAPPPPQMENPGVPPSDQYFWVRGSYRWNGNGYAWIGGHWDTVRTGMTFVPPFWDNQNGRYVHVEGHWISRQASNGPPPPQQGPGNDDADD